MANKSKNILIFTTAYKPFIGGSEIAIEEIVKRLPNVFFDIVTPKLKRGLPKVESADNYCIHRIGAGWPGDKVLFPWTGFIYANNLFKKRKHDMFHVFQASHAGGAAWFLKLWHQKVPMVLTIQEGKELDRQNSFIKFTRKLIVKRADRITVISEYLKNYILNIKRNVSIEVIPNGVDTDRFSEASSYGEVVTFKEWLKIKPDEKVIVSASRLVEKNGVKDLIRAMALLNRAKEGVVYKLLLVGDGEQRESLAGLIKKLNMDNEVIFTGKASHHDLPKYLMVSDVFVRPSLSEGLGNAFLEAMSSGVPVVGTKVGGIPDFIIDGETGLFCKVNNPESVAEKINEIFADPKLRNTLRKRGRSMVKDKYNWDKIAKQYRNIYFHEK